MADEQDFLNDAYRNLALELCHHPEAKEEIFETFCEATQLKENDVNSLRIAYETLGTITKEKEEYAEDALIVLQEALKNKNNKSLSLEAAYRTLGDIVKIKPDLKEHVFSVFKETMRTRSCSDQFSVNFHCISKNQFECGAFLNRQLNRDFIGKCR